MQNKKVTMLAAVLAVTVIAMAGVGYAVNYTAQTSNTNNTLEPTYIVLNQSSGAMYSGFLKDLYFNTDNVSSTTTHYTPVCDYYANHTQSATGTESKTLALVSNAVVLTLTPTNNNADKVNLVVTANNYTGSADGGLTYEMVLTAGTAAGGQVVDTANGVVDEDANTITWTFNPLTISKTEATNWYVMLFASGSVDQPVSGFPAKDAEQKSTFTFVATA